MPGTFRNSPTKASHEASWIETGVVTNVNTKNLTIDWVSQFTSKTIQDLPLMRPYFHYNNGEGFTCVPEVGALCAVCWPSDDDPPFVIGFLGAPELEGAEIPGIENFVGDGGIETEEGTPKPVSTTSGGSTTPKQNPTDASYRGGLPILNPGDMLWQGRDGNFVALHRGGVLQLGSTQICQRAYIPVLNFIRDFCENWEMNSAAGTLSWTVQRKENDPSGNAPTEFELLAREYAQDKKASVKVLLGSLDKSEKPPNGDKTFIELTIAPQQIKAEDGTIEGEPVYVLRLDKAGNTYSMQAKTRTVLIKEDDKLTVEKNQEIEVKKDYKLTVGGKSETIITGEHTIKGDVTSKEEWAAMKSITAQILKLGDEAASEPAVLGLKLAVWLATHVHPPFHPPVQANMIPSLLSKKVFVV
jgi:hypothetical protein